MPEDPADPLLGGSTLLPGHGRHLEMQRGQGIAEAVPPARPQLQAAVLVGDVGAILEAVE